MPTSAHERTVASTPRAWRARAPAATLKVASGRAKTAAHDVAVTPASPAGGSDEELALLREKRLHARRAAGLIVGGDAELREYLVGVDDGAGAAADRSRDGVGGGDQERERPA